MGFDDGASPRSKELKKKVAEMNKAMPTRASQKDEEGMEVSHGTSESPRMSPGARNDEWEEIRMALEAACAETGRHGKRDARSRRAMLTMEKQPGHLLYQCLDECLMKAKLSEIPHSTFPGAFANESVGTFWKAWIASSIFGRQDIDIAQKIKLYRQGAVCLNGKALKNILKFAYDRCTTRTEFLCETHSIRKHQPMEKHHVEDLYDAALKGLKEELNEESKESKPIKDGPVLFAAPDCAALLENDGIRGGIRTEVVNGVSSMLKKFDGWSSCGTWVLIGL